MMMPSDKRISTLLSLYLDNALPLAERAEVERLLDSSPGVRRHFEELRHVKNALGDLEPIQENESFYDDLYRRLPRPSYIQPPERLFQRKFIPAFAGFGALALVALVTLVVIKADKIAGFFSQTTQEVQIAYEENVLKGWIMPLFDKTGRDEALQYAMFGVIPLDDSSNTVLRVDNSVEQGYSFELGQSNQPHFAPVTVDDLYREVQPTEAQRQILDTIFYLASKQIEEGVLLDENEQLAISPAVIDLQRTLIAKVAATLDTKRRARMEDFLESRNAYYAVRASNAPPVPRTTLVKHITENAGKNTFVMISQDTILLSELTFDRQQLRDQMSRAEETQRQVNVQFSRLAQQLARRYQHEPMPVSTRQQTAFATATTVQSGPGNSGMRIHITINREQAQGLIASFVEPRHVSDARVRWAAKNNVLAPAAPLPRHARATIEMTFEMDSMLSMQEEALMRMEQQLQQLDTQQFEFHGNNGSVMLNLDSLERIIRIATDSMYMELRRRPSLQRDAIAPEPGTPPGIEIRPDYYEQEQKRRNSEGGQYLLDGYRHKLREFKSQHEHLRRVTDSRSSTRTVTEEAPIEAQDPPKEPR